MRVRVSPWTPNLTLLFICAILGKQEENMSIDDFAIGDRVLIKVEIPGEDLLNREAEVKGLADNYAIIVRPKCYSRTFEVAGNHLQHVKRIVRNRKKKLLSAPPTETETSDGKDLLNQPIGGYGSVPKEAVVLLGKVADIVEAEVGSAFGSTTLFWGLIHECNRHTDKTQVKRG